MPSSLFKAFSAAIAGTLVALRRAVPILGDPSAPAPSLVPVYATLRRDRRPVPRWRA